MLNAVTPIPAKKHHKSKTLKTKKYRDEFLSCIISLSIKINKDDIYLISSVRVFAVSPSEVSAVQMTSEEAEDGGN